MTGWFQLGTAAFGGGTVATLLSPWITFGVEKRRERLAARRKLIDELRYDLSYARAGEMRIGAVLESTVLARLRRHLRREAAERLEEIGKEITAAGRMDDHRLEVCDLLDRELSDLERRWGLN